MKKFVSFALSAILMVCLSVSVFAASPQLTVGSVDSDKSSLPAGAQLSITQIIKTQSDAFAQYYTTNSIEGALVMIGDISIGDVAPDANTWIYINVAGMLAGDTVTVLHMGDNGTIDVLPAANVRVYNGGFEFQPTAFSPFAFVARRPAAPAAPAATTPAAPQTGVYA